MKLKIGITIFTTLNNKYTLQPLYMSLLSLLILLGFY